VDERTTLHIEMKNPAGNASRIVAARLDGIDVWTAAEELRVPLPRAGQEHYLSVLLGG
jgi:hypothetical protein